MAVNGWIPFLLPVCPDFSAYTVIILDADETEECEVAVSLVLWRVVLLVAELCREIWDVFKAYPV